MNSSNDLLCQLCKNMGLKKYTGQRTKKNPFAHFKKMWPLRLIKNSDCMMIDEILVVDPRCLSDKNQPTTCR